MTTSTDGRLLRGVRTRRAIVSSLLDLVTAGEPSPTSAQIAEGAGVSVRSVFQHFEDLEALYVDLVAEQAERIAPLVAALTPTGTLEERIDALVAQRRTLFETITPVRRSLSGRVATSPAIRARLSQLDTELRRQVETQFHAELLDRPGLLEPVDLLTSFAAWDRLRTSQGLEAADAARALQRSLLQLLG